MSERERSDLAWTKKSYAEAQMERARAEMSASIEGLEDARRRVMIAEDDIDAAEDAVIEAQLAAHNE